MSLVGYTNAGKSTLFTALTEEPTFAADQLFATLDPLIRKWQIADEEWVFLSDTVGFIRKLPHTLVAAFRATLEEVLEADLLLHVLDASHPLVEQQKAAVEEVLREIGCDTPIINVYNKIDKVDGPLITAEDLQVSALTKANLKSIGTRSAVFRAVCLRKYLPFDQLALLSAVHEQGEVIKNFTKQTECCWKLSSRSLWLSGCGLTSLILGCDLIIKPRSVNPGRSPDRSDASSNSRLAFSYYRYAGIDLIF